MRKTIVAVLVVSAALAVFATDEDPSRQRLVDKPAFTDEVEVTVANLDVFVRDRQGRPVQGLTADDFRILQDGTEMPISNFTAVASDTGEAPVSTTERLDPRVEAAVAVPPPVQPHYVVLHFDNENLIPLNRRRAMNGIRTFVDEALSARVQMMVVSSRRTVEIRQPFTDDRDAINEALRRVTKETGARALRDRERRDIFDDMERFASDMVRESILDYLNTIEARALKVQTQGRIAAHTEEEIGILRHTLANLHQVLRLVTALDGRRSIIYVSNGIPMTPGLELMHEFESVFLDSTIYARIARRNFEPEFRALVDAANRDGVSLYTVDASGLSSPLGFGADDQYVPDATASWVSTSNRHETLRYMADATGALALLNSNDLTEGLRLIRDDLSDYYSLGYRITSTEEDTAHRIEVKLPDHPEYQVRHRGWLVEKSLDSTTRERVLQALARDVGHNPMDLRLSAGDPTKVRAKRWQVPVSVWIPLDRITLTPEDESLVAQLELFVCVRDVRDRESPMHTRQFELRIPRTGLAPGQEQRYEVSMPMVFREEHHAVAVGVIDRTGRQASVTRIEIDVP